ALVPTAGGATTREHDARAALREVGDELAVLIEDLCPGGHTHSDARTIRPVLAGAAAVAATAGREAALRAEAREITQIDVGDRDHVAAGPAVAAVRPALGHVLLAPEGQRAVAAAPRLHVDAGAIVEHRALVRVDDCDEAATAARLEGDATVAPGEDRVVAADARARARPETRSALADDDRPRRHTLAVEDLDAEHLWRGVAPVPRRSKSLLVCDLLLLLRRERGEGALALRMRLLVLERRRDLLWGPAACLLCD